MHCNAELGTFVSSFNRTIVELKFVGGLGSIDTQSSFNRTIVELKYGHARRAGRGFSLLIVP